MRAIFFGERDSTFSRLHLAQLARHAEVLLWVASAEKNEKHLRQPFLSRRDWWERMVIRGRFESQILRAFGKPARWLIPSNIPVYLSRRKDLDLPDVIARAAPDIIVSAGYRFLLPEVVLQMPRLGAFNCHPSLLPRYAGSNPWFWILRNGEQVSGVTIHRMVATADAGDIVAQQAFAVSKEMNHQALYNESSVRSARLLSQILQDSKSDALVARPQDLTRYQFFPSPRDADYRIDWNCSAAEIKDLVRAALPAPGAWTTVAGYRISVRRVKVVTMQQGTPAQVLDVNSDGVAVACKRDALVIHTVEWNGREYELKQVARELGLAKGICLS